MVPIPRVKAVRSLVAAAASAAGLLSTPAANARVLDDFNDNTKTAWTDFTFSPGFGLPTESGGQFTFTQPPAGQAIFSASQKTSELLELKEGRSLELRVDVIQAGGKDSFPVLAFIPQANSPGTLGGYGLAKSTTDFLITKGVNKYFYNENPDTPIKNDNITLVLNLTVKGGSVYIRGRVLDKDAGDAVIFEQTAVDTAGADVMSDGTDDPAAPYLTKGYFTLYLYQDFDAGAPEDPYQVVYDNATVIETDAEVVDNFDDNAKTDWTDFTFSPGFGLPTESAGQFHFAQPPAGQAIFSASQKTSRVFELKDGERLQFQADMVQGGGKDSFAVLAFIPQANSPGTLAGYGIAKSTTDFLIIKGINKYFYNENPAAAVKNENITLRLTLTALNGSVHINAQVLDKDDGDAVIFEQNAIDTPGADVMADGTDSPAAPYLTKGYFTLYLYQDFDQGAPEDPYQMTYDNAMAAATPRLANVGPVISEFQPAPYANFLPAATAVSFKISDDAPVVDTGVSITLNGVVYTTANGLVLSGAGNTRTATLAGQLQPNTTYVAIYNARDGGGETATQTAYFDTFATSNLLVETEDYNFDGGGFINAPVLIAEGGGPEANAYTNQTGLPDVDFLDTRGSPNGESTMYRNGDPIRMQHSLDAQRAKHIDAGGSAAGIFDYDVGDTEAGEWLNYTRDFPAGSYEVYLREALANVPTSESVLEEVTGDRTQPEQTVRTLGSFLGTLSGFQFRNYPLTDGAGQNKIVLRLGGVTTLRLRHVSARPGDGDRLINYLVFVRVSDVGPQKATIASVSPSPDSTVETVTPRIGVEIQNHDTSVDITTVKLTVNGAPVPPVVTATASGATVAYAFSPLPPAGATNTATIAFKDNQGSDIGATWSFIVTYKSLDINSRQTVAGQLPGFKLHVVQAPAGSNLDNSLARAEDQLRPNSPIVAAVDLRSEAALINFTKVEGQDKGIFAGDSVVPGIGSEEVGSEDFTVEALSYLEFKAGIYRFGAITDDGYKVTNALDNSVGPLAFHNGGPANETVDFVVPADGLYPFRFLWYERGGDAYAEWFAENLSTGERLLINDRSVAGSVNAWQELVTLTAEQSADFVSWGPAPGAVVDSASHRVTFPLNGAAQYYRLRTAGTAAPVLHTVTIEGNTLVVTYSTP